jgi:hypothetical protein
MRAWLVILEVFQAILGVWALFAPTSFVRGSLSG